jgi:putative FmdB family regulatory protein
MLGRSSVLPLYEYKCAKCGHTFEKIENHSASLTKKCPNCRGKAHRQHSTSAIQFKGSGWYATDYASKKGPVGASGGSGDGASAKPAEKPSEKPAETKQSTEKEPPKKKK